VSPDQGARDLTRARRHHADAAEDRRHRQRSHRGAGDPEGKSLTRCLADIERHAAFKIAAE
jgi:hypothetical protein